MQSKTNKKIKKFVTKEVGYYKNPKFNEYAPKNSDNFCIGDYVEKEFELEVLSDAKYEIEREKSFCYLMRESNINFDALGYKKRAYKERKYHFLAAQEVSMRFIKESDPFVIDLKRRKKL